MSCKGVFTVADPKYRSRGKRRGLSAPHPTAVTAENLNSRLYYSSTCSLCNDSSLAVENGVGTNRYLIRVGRGFGGTNLFFDCGREPGPPFKLTSPGPKDNVTPKITLTTL